MNNNTNNNVPSSAVPNTSPNTVPSSVPSTSEVLEDVNKSVSMPEVVSDPTKMSSDNNEKLVNSQPINREINNVNGADISTNTNGPRITDTSVVSKDEGMPTASGPKVGEFDKKLEEAQTNYKAPSNFKMFMTVVFFVLILAFIIFLPEVNTFLDGIRSKNKSDGSGKITTGRLVCTLDTNTSNLDKSYKRTFRYTDNKLDSVNMVTTTRGDVSGDDATLSNMNNSCTSLKNEVSSLNGISVDCEYSDGKLVETEDFDLSKYDEEAVSSAYTEAGLELIKFKNHADIDTIRTSMLQAGFTCEKEA